MTAKDYVATVEGGSGLPVLLLAGGASSSHGFFPGLVEALPDSRVISFDRPGTGRAQGLGKATLASGSAAVADAVRALGAGPAVVVGQSLGGAQAVQFAMDHPDLLAGLVLIDPTPLDTPGQLRTAKLLFQLLGLPGRLPVVGPRLDQLLFRALGGHVAPGAEEAFRVMTTSASLHTTARALDETVEETAALAARVAPLHVPAVLLTADRKPTHEVRLSHERLAAALGARVVAPKGAVHAEHVRDPKGVNDLVVEVVAEATARQR